MISVQNILPESVFWVKSIDLSDSESRGVFGQAKTTRSSLFHWSHLRDEFPLFDAEKILIFPLTSSSFNSKREQPIRQRGTSKNQKGIH